MRSQQDQAGRHDEPSQPVWLLRTCRERLSVLYGDAAQMPLTQVKPAPAPAQIDADVVAALLWVAPRS
jgi:hypothetical protein